MLEDNLEKEEICIEEESVEKSEKSESIDKELSKKEKKDKNLKKINDLELEVAELKEKLLRNSAELANFKRRINDERIQDRKYASMDLVSSLINPLENLRLVCNMPTDDEVLKNFLVGFKMINDQIFDVLTKDGLKEIVTLNEGFNPKLHKAIESVEVEDCDENLCIEEVQKGYMYKDRVLRCANVKVSKKPNKNLEN